MHFRKEIIRWKLYESLQIHINGNYGFGIINSFISEFEHFKGGILIIFRNSAYDIRFENSRLSIWFIFMTYYCLDFENGILKMEFWRENKIFSRKFMIQFLCADNMLIEKSFWNFAVSIIYYFLINDICKQWKKLILYITCFKYFSVQVYVTSTSSKNVIFNMKKLKGYRIFLKYLHIRISVSK